MALKHGGGKPPFPTLSLSWLNHFFLLRVSAVILLGHLQLALAQNFYSVAQLGRALKFKALGRSTHLRFKSCYRRFNVCRRIVFDVIQLGWDSEVVGF